MDDFFNAEKKTLPVLISAKKLGAKEILRQSTEGLAFLHGLGYLHRNVKPSNFRIASYQQNQIFQIKITDFRRAKYFIPGKIGKNSGPPTSEGWFAPEYLDIGLLLDQSVDVFILGIFYYYVLFGGHHLFDHDLDDTENKPDFGKRYKNIIDENFAAYSSWSDIKQERLGKKYEENWKDQEVDLKLDDAPKAIDLIQKMVKFSIRERIDMKKVLAHEYFSSSENYVIYEDGGNKPGLLILFSNSKFVNQVSMLIKSRLLLLLCCFLSIIITVPIF